MDLNILDNVNWADPDFLLTRQETASILRIEPETLAKWACLGKSGLPMVKIGSRARYRLGDVREYIRNATQALA